MPKERRRKIAYHEAGHAVAALTLGREISHVEVSQGTGCVVLPPQTWCLDPDSCDPASRGPDAVLLGLMIDVAGQVAVDLAGRAGRISDRFCGRVSGQVGAVAAGEFGPSPVNVITRAMAKADALAWWHARRKGRVPLNVEPFCVILDAEERAEALLRGRWPAVERLAVRLCEGLACRLVAGEVARIVGTDA